jgi:hypothetical protein
MTSGRAQAVSSTGGAGPAPLKSSRNVHASWAPSSLVAARQIEARGLGVKQALVPAQERLERELVASLRGFDERDVVPQARSGRPGMSRV